MSAAGNPCNICVGLVVSSWSGLTYAFGGCSLHETGPKGLLMALIALTIINVPGSLFAFASMAPGSNNGINAAAATYGVLVPLPIALISAYADGLDFDCTLLTWPWSDDNCGYTSGLNFVVTIVETVATFC